MSDLRQVLTQGRKRIGILVGAGAPMSIKIDQNGNISGEGEPLIPDVAKLTKEVIEKLDGNDKSAIDVLLDELGPESNIETILTQLRRLSQAIGSATVHGLNGQDYHDLAGRICNEIGQIVAKPLPKLTNPYTELVSWIGGTHREHPIEIFTPNYDLLFEEAFERAQLPYFDGFTGSHKPFFDPTTITADSLPPRWSRLWKIHGSLGWDVSGSIVIRTGDRNATQLIYPDHLKYDQITRQPYSALFERLRGFLETPDSLLICTGFSFYDAHITAVLDEALAANSHTAVLAFQFRLLEEEQNAVHLAERRPNISVYAKDGAVISGISGKWKPGDPPNDEWMKIRRTFWNPSGSENEGTFTLGDFANLSLFFALSHSSEFETQRLETVETEERNSQGDDDAQS